MEKDICQVNVIHHEHVNRAKLNMPEEQLLTETAEVFSMLGDLSRLRILQALSTTELCVCDLSAILETTPSAVSHQLRLLRAKKMVRFRKAGKMAYYSLADEHVQHLLAEMLAHLQKR
ncbi:MAG: ArsR/SmtB family transcription factor [Desulfuromonadales bacterium]